MFRSFDFYTETTMTIAELSARAYDSYMEDADTMYLIRTEVYPSGAVKASLYEWYLADDPQESPGTLLSERIGCGPKSFWDTKREGPALNLPEDVETWWNSVSFDHHTYS